MILADKIIDQRKKCGWSQEELADKLGVSRQAVSKWESAQSTPDLERILELGRLFGVSTDYLLKDDLSQAEYVETDADSVAARCVSMEEACAYLDARNNAARKIALASFLCILSPICLLLLGALSETGAVRENAAAGIGVIVLLLFVAVGVAIFITCGIKSAPFDYLEKEVFETAYGVSGMVRERQNQYRDVYTRSNVLGATFCILSVLPLLGAAFLTESTLVLIGTVCVLLLTAGIGVVFFITAGVRWESMQKLLQEGDYTKSRKRNGSFTDAVKSAYWLVAVAIYLGYSFITNDWENSWIIWPVAGVLFGAVAAICNCFEKK